MVASLYILFEVLATVFCLHYLYGEKVKIEPVTASFIIFDLLYMYVIYYFRLPQGWTLLIYPIICLYCGVRFGFVMKSIIINVIIYMLLVGGLQITIMSIINTFFQPNHISEIISVIINALVFSIVILFFRNINLKKISIILQRKEKITYISALTAIAGMTLCLGFYKKSQGFSLAYYFIFVLSIVLIGIVLVDIGIHKMREKEIESELRLHKLYESSFQNLIEDICAKQHEFDNHINTIYSQHYLYHTYQELVDVQKKYCQDIVKANAYNKLLSKGNTLVIGFLYGKFSEAEKRGIDIEYKVKIGDLKSNVPTYKVIEVLGNLINNAIEALENEENLNRMKVLIIENSNEIAIDIGNECRNINYEHIHNFFKKKYSEKGENRGYGLYNVKRICDEYDIVLETMLKKVEEQEWLHFALIINKIV